MFSGGYIIDFYWVEITMAVQISKDHLFEKGTPFHPQIIISPFKSPFVAVYSIVRPSHMQERF